jgi:hypothetical protein
MAHMSLDDMISQMANLEEDNYEYQAYKLEIERRQTIALLMATEAQISASRAAKENAKYMLWSVVVAARGIRMAQPMRGQMIQAGCPHDAPPSSS